MEKKKGGRSKDASSREETLKKVFLSITILAGLLVLALLLVYAPGDQEPFEGAISKPIRDAKEDPKKPPASVKQLEELELFPDEGRNHVDEGTRVTYKTNPPTSGFHYARWLPPAVYEAEKAQPELLVHNLEHGNVVIYFNRDTLAKADLDALTQLPKTYPGQWDGVLLVEKSGIEMPLILTAWRVKMPLKRYDSKKVGDFLDAFRGRGPENPIR